MPADQAQQIVHQTLNVCWQNQLIISENKTQKAKAQIAIPAVAAGGGLGTITGAIAGSIIHLNNNPSPDPTNTILAGAIAGTVITTLIATWLAQKI